MSSGSLRNEMPVTAAFIDDLRSAFGEQYINRILARAMKGEPVFFAEENGRQFGTPSRRHGVRIGKDARGNSIDLDNPDAPKEPRRGGGPVAWQAALDQQKMDNEKGQSDGSK